MMINAVGLTISDAPDFVMNLNRFAIPATATATKNSTICINARPFIA